jgi:hypothetical protein
VSISAIPVFNGDRVPAVDSETNSDRPAPALAESVALDGRCTVVDGKRVGLECYTRV